MAKTFWTQDNYLVRDSVGLIVCDDCPCYDETSSSSEASVSSVSESSASSVSESSASLVSESAPPSESEAPPSESESEGSVPPTYPEGLECLGCRDEPCVPATVSVNVNATSGGFFQCTKFWCKSGVPQAWRSGKSATIWPAVLTQCDIGWRTRQQECQYLGEIGEVVWEVGGPSYYQNCVTEVTLPLYAKFTLDANDAKLSIFHWYAFGELYDVDGCAQPQTPFVGVYAHWEWSPTLSCDNFTLTEAADLDAPHIAVSAFTGTPPDCELPVFVVSDAIFGAVPVTVTGRCTPS